MRAALAYSLVIRSSSVVNDMAELTLQSSRFCFPFSLCGESKRAHDQSLQCGFDADDLKID